MIGIFSRFFLLLLLIGTIQVLILSNIHVSPLVNVFLFPVFILILPFGTPRWFLLLLSLGSGLLIDVLLGTMGMHASAAVSIGYVRPFLIDLITPRGTDFDIHPNIRSQGFYWFSFYVFTSLMIYIGIYILLEAMNLDNLLFLFTKWILSVLVSGMVILLFLLLVQSGKKRRFT